MASRRGARARALARASREARAGQHVLDDQQQLVRRPRRASVHLEGPQGRLDGRLVPYVVLRRPRRRRRRRPRRLRGRQAQRQGQAPDAPPRLQVLGPRDGTLRLPQHRRQGARPPPRSRRRPRRGPRRPALRRHVPRVDGLLLRPALRRRQPRLVALPLPPPLAHGPGPPGRPQRRRRRPARAAAHVVRRPDALRRPLRHWRSVEVSCVSTIDRHGGAAPSAVASSVRRRLCIVSALCCCARRGLCVDLGTLFVVVYRYITDAETAWGAATLAGRWLPPHRRVEPLPLCETQTLEGCPWF
mmetsp:Transcript_771/g.3054  ORF Transcript_771/g.3054 Transcript_771/m.3054 type:complete len:301 (+) Transcript_771:1447-2349(+)